MEKSEYETQAEKFLKETQTEFKAKFLKHGRHFEHDTDERDIYLITLKRGERIYKFDFGQSIANSGLRLFHDKEKTKPIRHKSFIIPQEIRDKLKSFSVENEPKKKFCYNPNRIIRTWFESKYFSLSGLTFDLGEMPTVYDVLTCLTKYDPDTFEEFCSSFGYDEDSRKAEKTYKAVVEEWKNIKMLWSDEEIEKLQEIQ